MLDEKTAVGRSWWSRITEIVSGEEVGGAQQLRVLDRRRISLS
jgi:hypothetical protein